MKAYKELERVKKHLTPQQYKTIKGQIKAGDTDGALKGMAALVKRKEVKKT